ncbi:MAG: SRPBCC family protein [Caulobacter sp.]|nr:SRPBCC family protein [Caulobacter sp.]
MSMIDAPEAAETPARITRRDDSLEITLIRHLDHAAATVWTFLTDPSLLPQWLAPGEIEPRAGGRARLDFVDSGTVIDSEITAFEPGTLLEYSWSGPGEPLRPVRWSLDIEGPQACRLTLTLTTPAGDDAGRGAAGWEAHLDMLAAALEGVPIRFPFERFKAARDAYRARLAST